MLFVTGDVHADIKGLLSRKFSKIKKGDAVVICGDLGLIWSGGSDEDKILKSLGKRKHYTLFVDGVHENFDLLNAYPVTEWNGGKVHVISGKLIHLMRGQIYNIDGKTLFTFGGGESMDKEMRTPHETWWEAELPTTGEMMEGVKNLTDHDWIVDYVITYEPPTTFKRFMESEETELNALNVYLDKISEKCKYKKWVFGSYHKNRRISSTCEVVFGSVIKLETV